jgi:DNA-binding NtrC family response regulator
MTIKARILVVDDEQRFRESISRVLESEGHIVSTASDGSDALRQLADKEFDVVLLDLKMPGMSGQDVYGEIQWRGYDVETICLTGNTAIEEATRLLQYGIFDYLLKPASVAEILHSVKCAVESKLLRRGELGINQILGGTAVE